LQERAASTLFDPVDERPIFALDEELERRAKLICAAKERNYLLWSVLNQFQMTCEQIEGGQKVSVDICVLFQKRFAQRETRAPFSSRQRGEELQGDLFETHQHAVQFFRSELPRSRDDGNIASEFLNAII